MICEGGLKMEAVWDVAPASSSTYMYKGKFSGKRALEQKDDNVEGQKNDLRKKGFQQPEARELAMEIQEIKQQR